MAYQFRLLSEIVLPLGLCPLPAFLINRSMFKSYLFNAIGVKFFDHVLLKKFKLCEPSRGVHIDSQFTVFYVHRIGMDGERLVEQVAPLPLQGTQRNFVLDAEVFEKR